MEQHRYWMWTKRRSHVSSDHLQASTTNVSAYDDSWEEQAFAEDAAAAGSLGGCIWPPRSYSCSFCGREFRSAQALGGHMNVHRRDRARLKQSPTSQQEDHQILHHHHDQNHKISHQNHNIQNNPFLPMGGFQYQSDHEVCNFVCNPNPNSNHATLPSPPSTSRVSPPPPTKENCPDQETFVPPNFSSPIVLEHVKKSSPNSWSNLAADRYYHFSDLRSEGEKISPRILESGCRVKPDYVQTDNLSVSLNLVVRRTCPEEETVGRKRKRTDTPTLLPFFLDPISIERHHHLQPAEVPELKPSSVDDIDLELRLGDRPKVN